MKLRPAALLLMVASAGAQTAPRPEPVKPENPQVWEHRVGPEQAIHLTQTEEDERKKQRFRNPQEYFLFDIVVSESGAVESLQPAGKPPAGDESKLEEAEQIERARPYKPWLVEGVPARVKVQDVVAIYPPEKWGPAVPFPQQVDRKTLAMTLERTRCYGSCPGYTVTVLGDGTVQWNGDAFTRIPGHHTGHISAAAVTDLLGHFRHADFLSALPEYRGNWTDNPTQTLTLKMGSTTWVVVDYVGTDAGLPLAVRNLEGQVDEAAGTEKWIKGNAETGPSLVAEHWDFGSASADNMALYLSAIGTRNKELVDLFLAAKAPVIAPAPKTVSPMCAASGTGNPELVQRMVDRVKTIPARVMNQCLADAARAGSMPLVDFWLDKGADAKTPSTHGNDGAQTGPLEAAIFSGDPAIVRRMLDRKADAKADVGWGQPILSYAIQRGGRLHQEAEIVAMLAQAGADPNERGNMGETPLFDAWVEPALARTLLDAGANIEARDNNGNTPLLREAFVEAYVRELLAAGADPTATNKRGETAPKLARQYACPKCAELIEEAIRKKLGTQAPSSEKNSPR